MTSPFFIVGCGRSGTTLLRTMLNRHSDVAVPPEGLFVADYLRMDGPAGLGYAKRLLRSEYELKEWGVDVDQPAIQQAADLPSLVEELHRSYARAGGKSVWGHKTPRLVRHWRTISRAFPEARFLHVVRDPRATVASLIRSEVHRSTLPNATSRWLRDVSAGVEMESVLGARAVRVRYEDLVGRPYEVMKDVCEFLELDFEEAMIESSAGVEENSRRYYQGIHQRLSSPPDATRIEAWRDELSPEAVSYVESACQGPMSRLGYDVTGPPVRSPLLVGTKGRLHRVVRLPGQILHYFRYRRGYLSGLLRRKARLLLR